MPLLGSGKVDMMTLNKFVLESVVAKPAAVAAV